MGIPHLKPKRTEEYFSSTERKELSTTFSLSGKNILQYQRGNKDIFR